MLNINHFSKTKTKPTLFVCLVYLALFNLLLIGTSQSKYITSKSAYISARVAKPFIKLEIDSDNLIINSKVNEISGTFEVPPLSRNLSQSFFFSISNTDGISASEISLDYSITIISTNMDPNLRYSLSCTRQEESLVNHNTLTDKYIDCQDSYIPYTTLEGGELPCSRGVTHYYELTITYPYHEEYFLEDSKSKSLDNLSIIVSTNLTK